MALKRAGGKETRNCGAEQFTSGFWEKGTAYGYRRGYKALSKIKPVTSRKFSVIWQEDWWIWRFVGDDDVGKVFGGFSTRCSSKTRKTWCRLWQWAYQEFVFTDDSRRISQSWGYEEAPRLQGGHKQHSSALSIF